MGQGPVRGTPPPPRYWLGMTSKQKQRGNLVRKGGKAPTPLHAPKNEGKGEGACGSALSEGACWTSQLTQDRETRGPAVRRLPSMWAK